MDPLQSLALLVADLNTQVRALQEANAELTRRAEAAEALIAEARAKVDDQGDAGK